jgi:hypothetical protein
MASTYIHAQIRKSTSRINDHKICNTAHIDETRVPLPLHIIIALYTSILTPGLHDLFYNVDALITRIHELENNMLILHCGTWHIYFNEF